MNPARQAAVGGGLPVSVPAMTVNRVCGSGAQAIVTAAQEVRLGRTTPPSPAAWRTWTAPRTCWTAAAGATGWARRRSTTACCATA